MKKMHLNIKMILSSFKEGEETMRTTIELSNELISSLHALAVKKGYRGYSKVIEEAVHFYLKKNEEKESATRRLLRMRGSWSGEETREVKKRIEEMRKNWKF